MAYPETIQGELTGFWFGQKMVKGTRFRRRFEKKKDAEGYELYVGLMGTEPPTMATHGGTSGRTFAQVAKECRDYGGPEGKWKHGRDPSVLQRLDYVVTLLGPIDIADIDRKQLERITKSLQSRPGVAGRPLTSATINRYLNAASAVLTYAEQCGYVTHRPKAPLIREVSKPRGIINSFEEEDAILSALRAWGKETEAFIIQVLVTSGMRAGELGKIRPSQITNGRIHFEADQTKNDTARTVYIGDDMADRLRSIIVAGVVPDRFQLLRLFKRATKSLGLSDNLVIHSLRHTRNTRLRKQGVDLKVRMKMLGHKSIITSMRYDHVDDGDQLEAAKKVEAARGQIPENGKVIPFNQVRTA